MRAADFAPPPPDVPATLTVVDGRVMARPSGPCATPAESHQGVVVLDDGERLPVHVLALSHDDPADQVAVVRVGEDEHGCWIAGVLLDESAAEVVDGRPVWTVETTPGARIPVLASLQVRWPPPAAWFDAPNGLPADASVDVSDDGRVVGRWYAHGVCLRDGTPDCWTPPRGLDFDEFHFVDVLTAEGQFVRAGVLADCGGHAPLDASIEDARAFYRAGRRLAVVRIGEDDEGGWIVGAMLPSASEEDVALVRRSALSGDWRHDGRRWVALGPTLVNHPGLPLVASARNPGVLFRDEKEAVTMADVDVRVIPETPPGFEEPEPVEASAEPEPEPVEASVEPEVAEPEPVAEPEVAEPEVAEAQDARLLARLDEITAKIDALLSAEQESREAVHASLAALEARVDALVLADLDREMAAIEDLLQWWNEGAGGEIAWGEPGSFTRCVELAAEKAPDLESAEAFCAVRHFEATGTWPGESKEPMG